MVVGAIPTLGSGGSNRRRPTPHRTWLPHLLLSKGVKEMNPRCERHFTGRCLQPNNVPTETRLLPRLFEAGYEYVCRLCFEDEMIQRKIDGLRIPRWKSAKVFQKGSPPEPTLVRVTTHNAVAGLALDDNGICIEAAPILRYMQGWEWRVIRSHILNRRWTYESCTDSRRQDNGLFYRLQPTA